MQTHLLLKKAFIYPSVIKNSLSDTCTYSNEKGYWIISSSKEPLVLDKNGPKPQSKKADQETGEDRKGE